MDWLKLKALAVLRWVRNAVVSVWNMHVDPPAKLFKFYFFACFSIFLAGGVAAVWLFGPAPSAKMTIPAADRFISGLPSPASPLPVEPLLPAIVTAPVLAPVVTDKAPVPTPAASLPKDNTPVVAPLKAQKSTFRKKRKVKKPAAEPSFWSF
jgi:hypothetical protein